MPDLGTALQNDKALKAELLRQFPELSDDEQALIDTLDGISDLDEQILAVLRLAVEREALATGLEVLMEKHDTRRKRLQLGAEKLRDAVLYVMLEAGRKKIVASDMTVSVAAGRAGVQITDETALPDSMVKMERVPLKSAIKDALKAGQAVPGAMPTNPRPTLNVRLS
jgi:hypothetical protein